jgi:hypothetical protein
VKHLLRVFAEGLAVAVFGVAAALIILGAFFAGAYVFAEMVW